MSRRRKPPTSTRKPRAPLTARQRQRLNNNRPPVPHDHTNQAAQPLITTAKHGNRILNTVRRANVAPDIENQLDGPGEGPRRGRKRILSVEALLTAMIVAAYDDAKSYHRSAVVRALLGLDAAVAYDLGVCTARKWKSLAYKTTAKRIKDLEDMLLLGWFQDGEYRDFNWLATRLLWASIPPTVLRNIKAAALDETPRPMWARRTTVYENQEELVRAAQAAWRKQNPNLPVPTDPDERVAMIEAEAARRGYEVGPDGRLMHGKDPDARMGWASATATLPAGFYVGYGLTLLVACPEAIWRGNPDKIELGNEIPPYILGMAVTPAGTDPGKTGLQVFESGLTNAPNIKDVVTDRGYSTKRETLVRLVHQMGVNVTQDYKEFLLSRPYTITVGSTAKTKDKIHIHCGTLLPQWITKYWEKPPARFLRPDKKDKLAKWYATRARLLRFADRGFYRNKAGQITGKRFQCPACAGHCPDPTGKAPPPRGAPALAKPNTIRCCGGVVTIDIADLDHYQIVPYGTPAWLKSYARRNIVETVNSMLKPDKGREIGRCQAMRLAANTMASIALAVAHNLKETDKAQKAETRQRRQQAKALRSANQTTNAAQSADDPTNNEQPPSDVQTDRVAALDTDGERPHPATTAPDTDDEHRPPDRPPNRAPP